MPHFKEFLDPNFLSNIDFINDKMEYTRMIVTITGLTKETTHNGKGGSDKANVLHFKEVKKMILSPKNFKTILHLTKKVNVDEWNGTKIELYILENQKHFGEFWDIIRVAEKKIAPDVPIDYTKQENLLKACLTLDELQAAFLSLTGVEQRAVNSLKDELKKTLPA